jgi:small subunit ribosomal protein S14
LEAARGLTNPICFIKKRRFGGSYSMAKTSVIVRSKRTPKFKSRVVRRCFRCGRKHGYMRDFDMCRICFREFANEGMIPGIKKSSW